MQSIGIPKANRVRVENAFKEPSGRLHLEKACSTECVSGGGLPGKDKEAMVSQILSCILAVVCVCGGGSCFNFV